ncbi:hypothetical protein FJ567_25500 [Mesorhizobium sp. B2-4-16]|nr:hypothetical protein FJ567_25500 [Mesorhizobium sp. B2-4-16]TPL60590.1 hypothetical protein FJ956_27370 [Mesorhizobium sp. B2-4-3]
MGSARSAETVERCWKDCRPCQAGTPLIRPRSARPPTGGEPRVSPRPSDPTRGEGKHARRMRIRPEFIINSPPAAVARGSRWLSDRAPGSGRRPP